MRLVLLYFAVFALLSAQPSSPGYAAYERANQQFIAGKYQDSLNAIDEALRLDPKLVPALTLKAKLAMAANRYDVARESLERAIAADPKSSYAQFLYGFQFYQQNQLPEAIAALERARALNPRDERAALYLGLARESIGETGPALALYRESIRLKESSDALLACARLEMLLGDLDASARLIDRAIKADPHSRDPRFESARLLLKKGDAAQAAAEGEAALKLRAGDVTDRQVHYLLVQAYQLAGREADAEKHAQALRALEK